MTEPAKPAGHAPAPHAPAHDPKHAQEAGAKPAEKEPPKTPRPMSPDDPEFVLSGGGTGWYAYHCDAPSEPPDQTGVHEAEKGDKSAPEPKPAQPAPSDKIEGSVEANSREEAVVKISQLYPGARFAKQP